MPKGNRQLTYEERCRIFALKGSRGPAAIRRVGQCIQVWSAAAWWLRGGN